MMGKMVGPPARGARLSDQDTMRPAGVLVIKHSGCSRDPGMAMRLMILVLEGVQWSKRQDSTSCWWAENG